MSIASNSDSTIQQPLEQQSKEEATQPLLEPTHHTNTPPKPTPLHSYSRKYSKYGKNKRNKSGDVSIL